MDFNNILFDLGGVIVPLDLEKSYEAFQELGVYNIKDIFKKVQENGVWNDFETGIISEEGFLAELNTYFDEEMGPVEFRAAFNEMLLPIPAFRLELLSELKQQFNTALLSNTNPIHIEYINDALIEHGFENGLDDLFEKCYFSFDLGFRKPANETFQIVLSDMNWNASETIFFDDTVDNLMSAEMNGFQCELIAEGNTLEDLFSFE